MQTRLVWHQPFEDLLVIQLVIKTLEDGRDQKKMVALEQLVLNDH
ncbi:hypothetical protein [Bacillus sp. P14.5]|nr:hypothetical protein [Bacillus sp. P14.5]